MPPALVSRIAAVLFMLLAATVQARPIGIGDLDNIERVGDPQLSPDGQWVLYTVNSFDAAGDARRTGVWMVSWQGGEPMRVTEQSTVASTPRWSPDGRWISFLRDGQLWLLDRKGSAEARRVTDIPGGVGSYVWSPDSRRLAFEYREEVALEKDGDGKEIPRPWVIDRVRFKEDAGDGYLHDRIKPTRIYLYDLQARSFEPLTQGGEFEESQPAWSPDGSRIAFVSNREPDWLHTDYGDIYVVAARANSTPQRLTDFPGSDDAPAWSPDGRHIAYLQGSEPKYWMYNQTSLAMISASGGTPRLLAESLDRDIYSAQFSADGRSIRILVADDRLIYPAQVAVSNGQVQRLLQGPYAVSSISQAKERVALEVSSDRSPTEVFALEKGKLRALTRHNEKALSGIDLVDREDVEFTVADGERVHGLLAKPLGYRTGQRYPLILWLHGGPYGQDTRSFDNEVQLFAANGYAVLQVNYRGSSGRGKTYGRGIFADWGNRDVSDSLSGVDHVVKMGIADPERLGVGGWSYGGFLTDFIIVSDTRFKAAISGAGSGTKTGLYGTDLYAHGNELEWGTLWDNKDVWMRVSRSLYEANRVRTPTLFAHGLNDYNVPVSGSEQMYRALKTMRVPTQLVIYPGQHHGISQPSYARDLMRRFLDWYARYLSPNTVEASAVLIRNVVIVDGSGTPPYPGAVRIADGRIVEVGRELQARPGEQIHDGNGQVLAPGFIDTHSHHERGLWKKRSGDELLSQGVTTIVVGQDGGSQLPIGDLWRTLENEPVAVNVASYTGHNTIRSKVLGKNYRRVSTPPEVAKMAELLAADMRDGSLGLSSGLGYDPGIYADIGEVVELGKVTAPYGGRYISHIRNENVTLWRSIEELLQVGRDARIPVQLSHAKLSMVSLWGQAPKLLAMLDAARAEGIDATLDIYPYEYWQSTMTVALPERDFNDVAAARFVLANTIKPEGIRFTTYDADPAIVGKTLAEVAAERKADPAELYLQLIRTAIAKDADETIIGTSMSSADIATMMRWPHANICSDGETEGSHPRGAGSYARILAKYVREDRVLTLESAVHKMSGMAADHMGFKDRGYLRPGLAADLVLFDPATIQDHATVATPAQLATGVSAVWVNGELAWRSGRPSGSYPGKALRRASLRKTG